MERPNWLKGRRKRDGSASNADREPLREFVYLDEVSVYSLYSSQIGAIPSEITDSLSIARKGEISAEVSGGAPLAKGRLGGKFEDARSSGTQILRKASVQATFRDFLSGERDNLLFGEPNNVSITNADRNFAQLLAESAAGDHPRLIVDSAKLQRGRLLEMNVELAADPIFQVSAAIDAVTEMFGGKPGLASAYQSTDFEMATQLNEVLDGLMVGLIPVRCRLLDYKSLVVDGRECVVHIEALKALPRDERPRVKDVYLVGVTEQELYWRDIRRVLFAKSSFRVLARISESGLRDSWVPVKLVEVLKQVSPDLADGISSIGELARPAISDDAGGPTADSRTALCMKFATDLFRHHEREVDEEVMVEVREIASSSSMDTMHSFSAQREMLEPVCRLIDSRLEVETSERVASDLRASAMTADLQMASRPRSLPKQDSDRLIVGEIVAIYW